MLGSWKSHWTRKMMIIIVCQGYIQEAEQSNLGFDEQKMGSKPSLPTRMVDPIRPQLQCPTIVWAQLPLPPHVPQINSSNPSLSYLSTQLHV